MKRADFTHETPDGINIHVYSWLPDAPKAVVHVFHGMSEHGARYERLASLLTKHGFALYAHDHRGHGKTICPKNPLGHMADEDGWNQIVRDAHAVNRAVAAKHPGLPMIVFGHSMGSYVAQQLIYEHPEGIAALGLSATSGKPPPLATIGRGLARIERRRLGKRNPSPVLQRITFEGFNKQLAPNRTTADWLSRDPEEADKYVADPLCGFAVTTQTWVDMLDALPKIAENIVKMPKDMPVYIFAGDQDPACEKGKGTTRLHRALQKAGVRNLRFRLYENGRHEMLNDSNRDEVMNDLLAWFEDVYGGLVKESAA